jgi:hypothetical protein
MDRQRNPAASAPRMTPPYPLVRVHSDKMYLVALIEWAVSLLFPSCFAVMEAIGAATFIRHRLASPLQHEVKLKGIACGFGLI